MLILKLFLSIVPISIKKALDIIGKSWILSSYQEVLKKFLFDKPILIVAACNSKTSISVETIKNSKWLMYQAEIANIKIDNLKIKELTQKNGKTTSAMLYDNPENHFPLKISLNLSSLNPSGNSPSSQSSKALCHMASHTNILEESNILMFAELAYSSKLY